MYKKALEMEHLSVYTDSVRGTWRGSRGSFTGDSKRHVKKGFKKWNISLSLSTGAAGGEPGWRAPVLRPPRDIY